MMEQMRRGAAKSLNRLRYQAHLATSGQLNKIYAGPSLEDLEIGPSSKALIIAPHQDDEVIGCGGTASLISQKGGRVRVLYLTDGGAGLGPHAGEASIRMDEAARGLQIMGVGESASLDFPDGGLAPSGPLVEAIMDEFEAFRPDILFVPYYLDTHPDHAAAARAVATALKRIAQPMTCYSYEVWTALSPNVLIDVTSTIETKMQALREHVSQVVQMDYPEKVRGLNSFRSMCAGPGIEHCEAFIKQDKSEFIRMVLD